MAPVEEESRLVAIKRLGTDLLTSRSHINNCPALLSIISSSSTSHSSAASSSSECISEAIRSLQAFFVPLLRSGELSPSARKRARQNLVGSDANGASDAGAEAKVSAVTRKSVDEEKAEAVYRIWLWDKYKEFVEELLKVLHQHVEFPSLQSAAMSALMEFVRLENVGEFNNVLYLKICATLVHTEGFNKDILGVLLSHYLSFLDVCYFTFCNMERLAARLKSKQEKGSQFILSRKGGQDFGGISTEISINNIYSLLVLLPKASENIWIEGSGQNEVKPSKVSSESMQHDKASNNWRSSKKCRIKRTKAWLSFLQLSLHIDLYKIVLSQLHKTIIPSISSPILLSDFLTKSYNIGGLISVMALDGLYILITKHGLEYPDFYNKLYALLEPSIFVAKHRARFFELLDTCLKSSHLPAYLAAAFAKKLGRIALFSPPAGGLVAIAIIHNLLRRHPSINCLVHKLEGVDTVTQVGNPELDGEMSDMEQVSSEKKVTKMLGADQFKPFEVDTASCDALKSSLWEIETLRCHYCPAVSRFISSLETDLTVRAQTTEVAVGDFSSGSYTTIFSEEIGRRLKQVPLAFYKTTPSTLFPEKQQNSGALNDISQADFMGWNFTDSVLPETDLANSDDEKSCRKQIVERNGQDKISKKIEELENSLGDRNFSRADREEEERNSDSDDAKKVLRKSLRKKKRMAL